jgi:hypothetical protein
LKKISDPSWFFKGLPDSFPKALTILYPEGQTSKISLEYLKKAKVTSHAMEAETL